MFRSYFIIAIRTILKNKVFSGINIIGLGVSMSVSLLILLMVADQYSWDIDNPNKDRVYRINSKSNAGDDAVFATAPAPLATQLKQEYAGLEKVTTISRFWANAHRGNGILPFSGFYASAEFPEVMQPVWEKGDPGTALQEPFSLVLSREMAGKIYGKEDPLGKTLRVESSGGGLLGNFKITGILGKTAHRSHLQYDVLVSFSTIASLEKSSYLSLSLGDWQNLSNYYVYVLLKENQTVANLEPVLNRIVKRNIPERKEFSVGSFQVQRLRAINPGPANMTNNPGYVLKAPIIYLFAGLAIVVMLSACVNYTNLSIARALKRAREVGIRKVSGALRSQIIFQFLLEAIVIALLSLGIAVGLLQILRPAFYSIDPETRELFHLEGSPIVYGAFVVFAVLIGIVSGWIPALYLSRFQPVQVLKNLAGVRLFSRMTLRKGLVMFQFILSLVFIITAIVAYRQFNHVISADLGYQTDDVVHVNLKGQSYDRYRQAVASLAEVVSVSGSSQIPSSGENNNISLKKADGTDSLEAGAMSVDPHFVSLMQMKLIAGRTFPQLDSSAGERYVILNETAAARLKLGSPAEVVGQQVFLNQKPVEIIGVVKDFVYRTVQDKTGPVVLRNLAGEMRYANIRIKSRDINSTTGSLESVWKKVHPQFPFQYEFFNDTLTRTHSGGFNIIMKVVGLAGFLAIVIACLGLLGMVMYSTEARIKEVSIRKILGADVRQVVLLLSRGFLVLMALAILIAVPAAVFINSLWLQNYAYRIEVGAGIVLTGVGVLLLLGLITIGSQVVKAALSNPADTLRSE
jgi:putative ABC transport system permease protein